MSQPLLDADNFPDLFGNYSDILFTHFGDKVKVGRGSMCLLGVCLPF
jgi:hypothetical protein